MQGAPVFKSACSLALFSLLFSCLLLSFLLISSVLHVTYSSHVIPAAMMNLFRPTVRSPACCKIHLCPSTLWTSSVLSTRIPLRTFHAARFRAAAKKPAAPISTLISPFLPSSRHAPEKHFARRIPSTSHSIATSISSSRAAALPSVDVPAQSQNHPRNPPSSINLAFKVPPKALQRQTVLRGRIWNLPRPSGDTIVVRSSLLRGFLLVILIITVASVVITFYITACVLVLMGLSLLRMAIWGQKEEKEPEICPEYGRGTGYITRWYVKNRNGLVVDQFIRFTGKECECQEVIHKALDSGQKGLMSRMGLRFGCSLPHSK